MSSNPNWQWSEELQSYYFATVQDGRRVYVLQDRRIIPAADTRGSSAASSNEIATSPGQPRTLPQAGQSSASSRQSGQRQPDYTYLAPQRAQQASQSASRSGLTEGLRQLNVGSSTTGNTASAPQELEHGAVREVRDRYGTAVRFSRNQDGEVLLGTSGDAEALDPAFKKRPKGREFFKFGKVFFTLWTEPSTATGVSANFSLVRYGQRAHSQIRRFVVVREGPNYCICAPITTYGSQGVGKPGVPKHEHAVIYTGVRPRILPGEHARGGERPILDIAIQVDPVDTSDTLDPISRVNLGATSTIQHNLKVKPCGMVRNLDDLRSAYIQVRDALPGTNVPISSLGRPIQQPPNTSRQATVGSPTMDSIPEAVGSMGSIQSSLNSGSLPRGSAMAGSLGSSGSLPPSRATQQAELIRRQRAQQQEQQESSSEEEEDSDDEDSDEEDEDEQTSHPSGSIQPSQRGQQRGSQQQRPPQQPPSQGPSQCGSRRQGGPRGSGSQGNQSGRHGKRN